MIRLLAASLALVASAAASSREPAGLHLALDRLTREGRFSGAVVVRGPEGVRFARGYGLADPFTGRPFTPDTPVDSGSLAKPVTATAVLSLARDGKLDLDEPVRKYLPEYPYPSTTVRHLLAHSAAIRGGAIDVITGKTNEAFLAEISERRLAPLFAPGTGFSYCNFCYSTLAILIERVSGQHYLDVVRKRAFLPADVTIRPRRLSDRASRAIGYRRTTDGKVERADSYEDEAFYGSGNLSVSASQLADWGAEWSKPGLAPIRSAASQPATIAGKASGLTLGNWYCAAAGRRCHYLGHHEGFHHMLYWDADRHISVAMVSNNMLAPGLQQPLQRALVAFAEGRSAIARREVAGKLADIPVAAGQYSLPTRERISVESGPGVVLTVKRGGIGYAAYPVGSGIRYIPGLDVYIAGTPDRRLRWLSLYESFVARRP